MPRGAARAACAGAQPRHICPPRSGGRPEDIKWDGSYMIALPVPCKAPDIPQHLLARHGVCGRRNAVKGSRSSSCTCASQPGPENFCCARRACRAAVYSHWRAVTMARVPQLGTAAFTWHDDLGLGFPILVYSSRCSVGCNGMAHGCGSCKCAAMCRLLCEPARGVDREVLSVARMQNWRPTCRSLL